MIQQLLRPSLLKRFMQALRDDGVGVALLKVRSYCGVAFAGRGRSALRHQKRQIGKDSKYLRSLWKDLATNEAFHIHTPPSVINKARKVAIIADLNLPQCRKYRVEQLATFWRQSGVEASYSHYADVPRSVNVMQDATHLMLYRLSASPRVSMYMYEARRLRLPILFDLDDPLFSVSAYETYQNMKALKPALKTQFLADAPKYLDVMNGADVVSVSTPALAEHTRLYCPRPVFVRRNFADAETLHTGARILQSAPQKTAKDGVFRVAFASGSWGHEIDFALIEPQIVAFLREDPNRQLMVLGHFAKERLPKGVRRQIKTYKFTNYPKYLERLSQADCAVMPLSNDLFNHCKSAVRVLDAGAVGLPCLVSAVGDQANVVKDGHTGFVIQDPDEWYQRLRELAGNPDTVTRMGRAARLDVENHWSGSDMPHILDTGLRDWLNT